MKVCFELAPEERFGVIRLFQEGEDEFGVQYGLQLEKGLPYHVAAAKLGEAIMHKEASEGRLDPRVKGDW